MNIENVQLQTWGGNALLTIDLAMSVTKVGDCRG